MEFFFKHQKIILRAVGAMMLLVGFVVHFWSSPDKGVSKSAIAAANVARMEASVSGGSSKAKAKPSSSPFMEAFEEKQEKQMQYLTIIVMILGVGSLGYSFFQKEEEPKV